MLKKFPIAATFAAFVSPASRATGQPQTEPLIGVRASTKTQLKQEAVQGIGVWRGGLLRWS